VLGSKFIQVRNRSTYPPQEQFHIEGFLNPYALDPASTVERVVLVSESIEKYSCRFSRA